MIQKGADVNAQGGEYGIALHAASTGGYIELAELLIWNGAEITMQAGRYGNAPRAAFCGGHTKLEALLMKKAVNMDYNEEECSPRIWACLDGEHVATNESNGT